MSATRLRVGLNLMPIGERAGGIGRHAAELPGALMKADSSMSLIVLGSRELPPMPWENDVRTLRLPVALAGRMPMAVQLGGLPALGLLRRLDLLHSVANLGPPRIPGLPSIVTVHDLIWLHAGTDWDSSEAVVAMRRVALRSARWATRIQADSRATASDLAAVAGVPAKRIDVVPLGVRGPHAAVAPEDEVRRALDLGARPVVLAVAQKRPYKNLAAVIRAMRAVPEAALVLPGAPTPHERELRALAVDIEVADRVRFIDWVDEETLEGLYRLAACVVVPSLFEGFGLPVLEAMARGVPVACADAGSLTEVARDAAVLFDPHDDAAVGAAVARVVRDSKLRARLAVAGRRRARQFSWDRCAQETLESYDRALATSRRR
jgi:glycosyltransferase involved in cell wall biosynthesis